MLIVQFKCIYIQCCSVLFWAIAWLTFRIYGEYSFGFLSCCCPAVDLWGVVWHSDQAHCLCPPGRHMCTDSSHVLLSGRCRVSQHAAASENTWELAMGGLGRQGWHQQQLVQDAIETWIIFLLPFQINHTWWPKMSHNKNSSSRREERIKNAHILGSFLDDSSFWPC